MESILHPLILINISDHLTRESCRSASGHHELYTTPLDVVVIGALLGTLDGRQLALVNSFELAFSKPADDPSSTVPLSSQSLTPLKWSFGFPDWNFFDQRLAQYQKVFPTLELVGWYVAGFRDPCNTILQFLDESARYCDSPYVLTITDYSPSGTPAPSETALKNCCLQQLHQNIKYETPVASGLVPNTKQSPRISVQLFDKVSDISSNGAASLRTIQFKVESGEAERICFSHLISKAVRSSTAFLDRPSTEVSGVTTQSAAEIVGASSLAGHLDSWRGAADELKAKIHEAVTFLQGIVTPDIAVEQLKVCNELAAICHAIEREKQSVAGGNDESVDQISCPGRDLDGLEAAVMSQLTLVECSTLSSAAVSSLKRLVDLKAQVVGLTPNSSLQQVLQHSHGRSPEASDLPWTQMEPLDIGDVVTNSPHYECDNDNIA